MHPENNYIVLPVASIIGEQLSKNFLHECQFTGLNNERVT